MITVVGGTYVEHCMEPEWNRLLGSGLRAALALSKADDSDSVSLVTIVGSDQRPELEGLADAFGFSFKAYPTEKTISFSYAHCLSDPRISPRPDTIIKRQINVEGETILCYGMLDADVTVAGNRVVYDPQGPQAPVSFRSGKGTAEHLAVIANVGEARRLAGEHDLHRAAVKLLARERADVVVIKAGLRGAIIATGGDLTTVPAYNSEFAWTLGSGDLFAAAFAEFWANREMDPVTAADLASRAVALYAERRAIPPLNPDELVALANEPVEVVETGAVYLAGPFFTLPQRWLIEESRRELRRLDLTVNSPLHDIGIGTADEVAERDLELLRRSGRVFAILDGLDAGTLFEVGYARDRGLPVIALAQNVREEDLKMIAGSGCKVFDDFPTAIAAVLKRQ